MVSLEEQERMGSGEKLFLTQQGQANREIFKEQISVMSNFLVINRLVDGVEVRAWWSCRGCCDWNVTLHACPNRSIAYRTTTVRLCLDLGISIMNYRCALDLFLRRISTHSADSKYTNMPMNTAQVSPLWSTNTWHHQYSRV